MALAHAIESESKQPTYAVTCLKSGVKEDSLEQVSQTLRTTMLRDDSHRKSSEFLSRDKCISYIIEHYADLEFYAEGSGGFISNEIGEGIDDNSQNKNYFSTLSDKEIIEIYRKIVVKEKERRFAVYAEREPYLFFNQPSADADYTYWLDLEVWTADQAAALSMGKEPSVVNAESMSGPLRSSSVRLTYRNRVDAILSGIAASLLSEPIRPKSFVAWAISKKWDIPDNLMALNSDPNYETLKDRVNKLEESIYLLELENKKLKVRSIDDLDPRLKESYEKVILGMAIARYGHKVRQNSRGPASIARDIEDLKCQELAMSAETISKILRAAADNLHIDDILIITPKWSPIKK